MDQIRIIHTGDTHLGYRQYHSDIRRKDFLNAFSTVVDDAINMEVDAVVHAGDLFDSRNPTLDDILDAMDIFIRLKNAGIPMLAIVGNHESKQNTQWLDLYSSLGLVKRLSEQAFRLGDVALYGIDSVAKTKIPLFDYSIFKDNVTDAPYNLLVMHQLVKPFPFGEWDISEVINSLPFDVHAVLLGDYHKHEVTMIDDVWVTYAGSTERNSTSEREPRSYNIVTIGEGGIDISKRSIPTRDFMFIPVSLSEGPDVHKELFSKVMENDIEGKVVFVEVSGDVRAKLDFSEVEKFLLSRGALIPGIRDLRTGVETLSDQVLKVNFSDPDDVIKEEIKKMDLTAGGLLLDDIVRDPLVVKTRVGEEAEIKLGQLLESIDFSKDVSAESVPSPSAGTPPDDGDRAISAPAVKSCVDPNLSGKGSEYIKDSDSKRYQARSRNGVSGSGEHSITPDGQLSEKKVTIPESLVVDATKSHDKGTMKGEKKVTEQKGQTDNLSGEKNTSKDHAKPRQYNLGDYL